MFTQFFGGIKEDIIKLESVGSEFHLKEIANLEDNLAKAWERARRYVLKAKVALEVVKVGRPELIPPTFMQLRLKDADETIFWD